VEPSDFSVFVRLVSGLQSAYQSGNIERTLSATLELLTWLNDNDIMQSDPANWRLRADSRMTVCFDIPTKQLLYTCCQFVTITEPRVGMCLIYDGMNGPTKFYSTWTSN
jgi:hypothetical protein